MRRHHNNKGYRQIKNGKTAKQVQHIAKKLGIPYKTEDVCTPADIRYWRINGML